MEFLLDRRTETDYEMMKWKFAVAEVRSVVSSVLIFFFAQRLAKTDDYKLDSKQILTIKQYVRDGVAYKGSEVGVAFASEDM